MPYVILQIGADKIEVTSAFERLNSDGTYSESLTLRLTVSGQVSTDVETATGSWTQSGSAITFTESSSGDTYTGSISGNTLTIIDEGLAFVFRK